MEFCTTKQLFFLGMFFRRTIFFFDSVFVINLLFEFHAECECQIFRGTFIRMY